MQFGLFPLRNDWSFEPGYQICLTLYADGYEFTKMKAENGNWETKTLIYFHYLLLRQNMWTNIEVRAVPSSPASLADLTQGPLQDKKNKFMRNSRNSLSNSSCCLKSYG